MSPLNSIPNESIFSKLIFKPSSEVSYKNVSYKVIIYSNCDVILLLWSYYVRLLADSILAGFDQAICHVGEVYKSQNGGWALANSQVRTEALSPTTQKELTPTNNHVHELSNRPCPSQAQHWPHFDCSLVRNAEPEELSCGRVPDPQKPGDNGRCCFKPLKRENERSFFCTLTHISAQTYYLLISFFLLIFSNLTQIT